MHVFLSNVCAKFVLKGLVYTIRCHCILAAPNFEVLPVLLRSKLLVLCIYCSPEMHYQLMSWILASFPTEADWTDIVTQELCCFYSSVVCRWRSHLMQ
jgi:hypothetical protein